MEQKDFQRESSIPNYEQVDWPAIAYLQGQISKCKCDFRLEAYDHSIDKVLEVPKRKAKDSKLAEEVFKDSKRKLIRRNNKDTIIGKSIIDYNHTQELWIPAVEFELTDQKKHLSTIIKEGLNSLSKTEKCALYIKATKKLQLIKSLLGVSERQYRNIVKMAQQKLHVYPRFKEAFFLAFLDTDFEELDMFLQTILFNDNSLLISKAV